MHVYVCVCVRALGACVCLKVHVFVMFECVPCVHFKALSRMRVVCPEGCEFTFVRRELQLGGEKR